MVYYLISNPQVHTDVTISKSLFLVLLNTYLYITHIEGIIIMHYAIDPKCTIDVNIVISKNWKNLQI